VIVGDPGRTYLPRAGLVELAAYEVPVPAEIESVTLRRTKVYRLEPA
jgi:predicted nicotinamide N-methyase